MLVDTQGGGSQSFIGFGFQCTEFHEPSDKRRRKNDRQGSGGPDPPRFFMHVTQVNVTLSGSNATVSLPRGQLALHAWDS
jgi:hypothetical protein